MRDENKVYFASGLAIGQGSWVELAAESKDNLYIVRFWKNGDVEYAHNCLRVSELPKSPLANKVMEAKIQFERDIQEYLHATDTFKGSQAFWKIKNALNAPWPHIVTTRA